MLAGLPTYVRVDHHPTTQALVSSVKASYPRLDVDVEAELAYYKKISNKIVPLIADTIEYTNAAFDAGRKILVEGE